MVLRPFREEIDKSDAYIKLLLELVQSNKPQINEFIVCIGDLMISDKQVDLFLEDDGLRLLDDLLIPTTPSYLCKSIFFVVSQIAAG